MFGAKTQSTIATARGLKRALLSTAIFSFGALHASAMDLKTALEITLQTNPEIAESAANRRAIGFEYEQAKRLSMPSVIIEGRAGPEWVDSRTTRLLGNDEDVLFGRQASVTIQQNLFNFDRNNSERDRQASRVDAAAQRVWERSELVSLDVVQSYFDILRLREILNFADQNVSFHQGKVSEIARSVSGGVQSEADAQQSRERASAALVSRSETEEALELAESEFVRLVGRGVGRTTMPPSVSAQLPSTLALALGEARRSNPTLHIARADLDTAKAEHRKAKAEKRPTLMLEMAGRAGEDIGGFRDTTNDVRAQVVFRHEFRGGIKSSAVQEHLNRIDEARQRMVRLERNVDSLVREAWATRKSTSQRRAELQSQVSEGTQLLDSYQREFNIGRRTLLDILDNQASLFQAQTALVTAQHADLYAQYRILASTGTLLQAMDLAPRREAKGDLRGLEKVEDTSPAETEPRRYPKHYEKTMGSTVDWAPAIAALDVKPMTDFDSIEITPVQRQWVEQNNVETIETRPITNNDVVMQAAEASVTSSPAPDVTEATYSTAAQLEVSKPINEETVRVAEATITPRVYGEYISPAPMMPVTVVLQNHETSPASVQIVESVGHETALSVESVKLPIEEPSMDSIFNQPEPAPTIQEAALENSADNGKDSMPLGVPILKVDIGEFTELKKQDNIKIYWGMNAILHQDKLYLLEG